MADAADETFEQAQSGASETVPKQCSALRKGEFVLLKGRPCKIMEMTTSKTGKHGHAKVHLTGLDIFTNKKYEDLCPSTHNMEVPNVTRKDYLVCNITDDDFVEMFDEKAPDNMRSDLKVPDSDVGKEIKDKFENGDSITVTVLKALKDETLIACKLAKDT